MTVPITSFSQYVNALTPQGKPLPPGQGVPFFFEMKVPKPKPERLALVYFAQHVTFSLAFELLAGLHLATPPALLQRFDGLVFAMFGSEDEAKTASLRLGARGIEVSREEPAMTTVATPAERFTGHSFDAAWMDELSDHVSDATKYALAAKAKTATEINAMAAQMDPAHDALRATLRKQLREAGRQVLAALDLQAPLIGNTNDEWWRKANKATMSDMPGIEKVGRVGPEPEVGVDLAPKARPAISGLTTTAAHDHRLGRFGEPAPLV